MKKTIFLILLVFGLCQVANAQRSSLGDRFLLSDDAQISLLTNTPWDGAIYALFGHTSIRVNDPNTGIDTVFNYGIFSMSSSGFIFHFVKGETDYMVAAIPYAYYLEDYQERKVGVIEQVFNLTQEEKQEVYDALVVNSQPENRVYRYNYFYDNCSTRPRDIIEKYLKGKIEYTPTNKQQTYRDLVHECLIFEPWTRFGIDLVIGADADKVITDRQKDFLPSYLQKAYSGAIVLDRDGNRKDLISETNTILESFDKIYAHFHMETVSLFYPCDYPIYAGIVLLIITILISYLAYKKNFIILGKTYDTLLFLVAGLAGFVIFFLMFFSEHPCTNPNWNIVWLNPLQLIVACLFFVKSISKYIYYYHFINFVTLSAFLLAWCLIPQQLEIAFIPFILSICLRSGMNILERKKHIKVK